MTAQHTDSLGRHVVLGTMLGRGGEATVYEVPARSGEAAKIYAHPSEEKAAKLRAMIAGATPDLVKVCAWPTELLQQGTGSSPVGFLMRKLVQSHPLDSLIVPAQRNRDFPGVDWRFIVHTARNLADAVGEVHRHGLIVGDLNENNVRVTGTGEVRFIDCDSFQVRTATRTFRCPVATLLYWPPELQGESADAVDRTTNHDAFALAVLLFRLLFLGRHPFAGRYTGNGEQPDIPELIRTHRFAFGAKSAERQVLPPPDALRLHQLPTSVGTLFERAFAPNAAMDGSRPMPTDWVGALDGLAKALKVCPASTAHWYPSASSACPWCEIERSVGFALFIGMQDAAGPAGQAASSRQVDVDALWRAITAVPIPAPAIQLLPEPLELRALEAAVEPPVIAERLTALGKLLGMVSIGCIIFSGTNALLAQWGAGGLILATLLYVIGKSSGGYSQWRRSPARQAGADLRRSWKTAQQEIEAASNEFSKTFEQLRGHLAEHKQLRANYEAEYEQLKTKSRTAQTHEHLQRYPVRASHLSGIGPTVIAALESYGIYTADDVAYDRVLYVKGIGPKRASALVSWKQRCESQFKPDSRRTIDAGALAALKQKYVTRHEFLAGTLASGPRMLTNARERIEQTARDRRAGLSGLAERAEALLKR
ncbi:MAG: hypothetical protein JWM95_35 [Gemmatimonadetes bacterium]|nr:hypothetical protein [Gemmatimonadota bacterium]